jgi:hypothetical protein
MSARTGVPEVGKACGSKELGQWAVGQTVLGGTWLKRGRGAVGYISGSKSGISSSEGKHVDSVSGAKGGAGPDGSRGRAGKVMAFKHRGIG